MRALPLRLEGPLQSWGAVVVGNDRRSLDAPTRSGVLGLVAGALGIDRRDSTRLAALHASVRLIVRGDRAGKRSVDFHTALEVPRVKGGFQETVVTRREYLQDASFTALLVAEASPSWTLEALRSALLLPAYMPFLGRKSCVPSVPVHARGDTIVEGTSWQALLEGVALAPPRGRNPVPESYPVWLDASLVAPTEGTRFRQRDVALPALARLFTERDVVRTYWRRTDTVEAHSPPDPFFDDADDERVKELV